MSNEKPSENVPERTRSEVAKRLSEVTSIIKDRERIDEDNWEEMKGRGFEWFGNTTMPDPYDPYQLATPNTQTTQRISDLISEYGSENVIVGIAGNPETREPDSSENPWSIGVYVRKKVEKKDSDTTRLSPSASVR